jgi:hypothetical protein
VIRYVLVVAVALASGCAAGPDPVPAEDPLPSWNEGSAKAAILDFVRAVTDTNGNDYVEPAERIAVFDNDGTLWVDGASAFINELREGSSK